MKNLRIVCPLIAKGRLKQEREALKLVHERGARLSVSAEIILNGYGNYNKCHNNDVIELGNS